MSIEGISNTARALTYQVRRQEVTANNLANANSDAFKADRLFARTLAGQAFPVAVQETDLQQGTFRETARPLDFALTGDGFLVVATAQGERLTRGGSFQLDPDGRLVDGHGDPVMGLGGPLHLSGGTLEVQGDGSLMVDGALAGRLRVVEVADRSALRKEGLGRWSAASPLTPADEARTHVRQGAVEESNVDPLLTMVDLITIQRAYSANVDALKAMDSVLGSITNEVGRVH